MPDTIPVVSPNRGHNARGDTVSPRSYLGTFAAFGRGWNMIKRQD